MVRPLLHREDMPPRFEPVEVWERRPGAATAPLVGYRRREPEKTLLHRVVRARLEPFLASARDRSATGRGLPAHVEGDLRRYLASSAVVSSLRAKAVGHKAPSSRVDWSLKASVGYLALNFCALWKKQTTSPSWHRRASRTRFSSRGPARWL